MSDRNPWHLSEEAIYDLVDRRLSPEARAEAERHLRSCPECARQVRRAGLLFARLEKAEPPRLERDLAPDVVTNLQEARKSRGHLRWVLAAQAIAAAVVLALLGLRLEHWVDALRVDPAYLTLREHGMRLVAEAFAWLAPFLAFTPTLPNRLASVRITIPHLEGPVQGWVGLAAAALALGLAGNAVLLRSADGVTAKATGKWNAKAEHPGRISQRPRGGRR